ncbi:MAG: ArnT family glycosyltransferase [Cellvibrionaceae bacterium]
MPIRLNHLGRGWALIGLILGVSLILRIGYNLTLDNEFPFRADAGKYITLALNLVNYGVYSLGNSAPLDVSTLITPGYPLLLSLILKLTNDLSIAYTATLVLQAVMGTGTVFLTYLIASQCKVPKLAAIASMAIIAFYPHQITSGGLILTETLFTFLMMLATSLIIRGLGSAKSGVWIWAGVILGLAALTRPIALPIGIGIWLTLIILQPNLGGLRRALPAAILPLLIFAPWLAFSQLHHDENQVSNAKSVFALGTYPNFIYKSNQYFGFPHREDPDYPKMQESLAFTLSDLKQRAESEPLKYLHWYTVGKPSTLWQWEIIQGAGGANIYPIKHSLYDNSRLYSYSYSLLNAVHPILVLLAFLACLYTIWQACVYHLTRERANLLILASIFGYIAVVHTLMASLPRFSIPFQPIMILLAASWLTQRKEYRGTKK